MLAPAIDINVQFCTDSHWLSARKSADHGARKKDGMGEQKHQEAMQGDDEAMQGDDSVIESPCRFDSSQPPVVGSHAPSQPMLSVDSVMDVVRAFFQPAGAGDGDAARAHENRRRMRR